MPPIKRISNPKQKAAARKHGWRSGLEEAMASWLTERGVPFEYEALRLEYRVEETRHYTPDFPIVDGPVIETKGRWETADRKKIKLIRAQHPDLDLRMVFSNPNQRISKTSRTTYAAYCEALGIPWAKFPHVPMEWFE